MKPALTAEEWNPQPHDDIEYTGPRIDDHGDAVAWIEADDLWLPENRDGEMIVDRRHALAALALHGQPFGFTWDDVVAAKEAAFELRMMQNRPAADRLDDLANRIASLLPPREEGK
jgi:hypothetical protein